MKPARPKPKRINFALLRRMQKAPGMWGMSACLELTTDGQWRAAVVIGSQEDPAICKDLCEPQPSMVAAMRLALTEEQALLRHVIAKAEDEENRIGCQELLDISRRFFRP